MSFYPDSYEYAKREMKLIEAGIKAYYNQQPIKIYWYKRNDPINYIDKIDSSVVVVVDERIVHAQIKSSKYPESFTVGYRAMKDYLTNYHNIEALIVVSGHYQKIHFFNWFHFIDLAQDLIDSWENVNNKYYIIPLQDLFRNIVYKSFRYN